MDEYRRANREVWDEWAQLHAAGAYDVAGFKAGRSSLKALELAEVGEVQGQRLLHLQCHFGMDTLSWARRGAQVTGVDFSPEAIRLARELAAQEAPPVQARFIESDLYALPEQLDETFDVVFTSYGVLTWLDDIPRWAQIAARYVRPGGTFYIAEFHPAAYIFSDQAENWQVELDYFHSGVLAFPVEGSYADRSAQVHAKTSYEWNYPLGTVVSSLIAAGLTVEFLHEFEHSVYRQFPFLQRGADGLWRIPPHLPRVPLMFSLRAHKS